MPKNSTLRSATPWAEAAFRQSTWCRVGVVWLLALCACGAHAKPESAKLRCGWFENPTPANASLTDREGEWIVAAQGGHQADGDWPLFSRPRWVRTSGNYGYGWACIKVIADPETGLVQRIVSSFSLPLQSCLKDPALARPRRD